MLNTININLKTDIKTDRPTTLPITLMSQDKNNNQFILRFTNGGESVTLDVTYTVEVLTKFTKSGTSRLTTAKVRQDYATWEFDTAYIAQDETVYNSVYVRKSGNLVVSADSNAFYFEVGLSEIDKGAGKVAKTYDENYEKVLLDYSSALDERTTERLDEAVGDFNVRGDAEIADWRVENSNELTALETEIAKKANKQQEDWITPTLLNGWKDYTGSEIQYMKDEFGIVRFRGRLNPESKTDIHFIAMPAGYRPNKDAYLNYGGSNFVVFLKGGASQCYFTSWLSLDGFSYSTI